MDGLTISNVDKYVESGKTFSDMKTLKAQSLQTKGGETGFANTLNQAIKEVDRLQKDADVKTQQLATGESKNVADVMIATEKADIALRLMVQVRNKVINAYNEIMKMQV